jgi:hypothetical protein
VLKDIADSVRDHEQYHLDDLNDAIHTFLRDFGSDLVVLAGCGIDETAAIEELRDFK